VLWVCLVFFGEGALFPNQVNKTGEMLGIISYRDICSVMQ
jgi:hypothetical protein